MKKVKADKALHGKPISELRDVTWITQCYLSLDTSECTSPNPSHTGRYSIYLPRRDGRL